MKKILSVLLLLMFTFSAIPTSFAEDWTEKEFDITPDGVITAYYGSPIVIIPDEIAGIKVKKIGEKAFFDLGIEEVYIADGLEEIGESAFEGANLYSIEFPSTLTKIDKSAFMNCQSLEYVYFFNHDNNLVIEENAFQNTPFIYTYIICNVDFSAFEAKFKAAKGGYSFDTVIGHSGFEEASKKIGNITLPALSCAGCGAYILGYPGVLGHPFGDVASDSWYNDYVDAAYNTGIINGKAEGVFDPDASMTCAEAAKIAASIHALLKGNNVSAPESDAWYVPYVDYCTNYGIIEDYIGFDWNAPITRAQMAYMFSRIGTEVYYLNDVPLTDIGDVSETTTFVHEILDLYNKGIAVGDEMMNFHPYDNIKRSEVSAIITRILFDEMRIELPKG